MEDEDYFQWSDDHLVLTTKHVYFRDTDIHIASLTDGHLDLTADITIDLNGITLATDKVIFTQTDANEYIDSLADGYLDIEATIGVRSRINGAEQLILTDGLLTPTTDLDVNLGATGATPKRFTEVYAATYNIMVYDTEVMCFGYDMMTY
jgi:hypothetical protein